MNSDTVADRVAALFHGSRGEHTRNALHEALVGCLGGVDGVADATDDELKAWRLPSAEDTAAATTGAGGGVDDGLGGGAGGARTWGSWLRRGGGTADVTFPWTQLPPLEGGEGASPWSYWQRGATSWCAVRSCPAPESLCWGIRKLS